MYRIINVVKIDLNPDLNGFYNPIYTNNIVYKTYFKPIVLYIIQYKPVIKYINSNSYSQIISYITLYKQSI